MKLLTIYHETVFYDDDFVRLSHDYGTGSYRFPLDIHYGFGLNLALLFSESEASYMLSTAKVSVMYVFINPKLTIYIFPSSISRLQQLKTLYPP